MEKPMNGSDVALAMHDRIDALATENAQLRAELDRLRAEVQQERELFLGVRHVGGQRCAACGKWGVGDYANTCAVCRKNLCDECMAGGHCDHVPALNLRDLPPGKTCGDCAEFPCVNYHPETQDPAPTRCSGFEGSHFMPRQV
jgi:hypothetical protein